MFTTLLAVAFLLSISACSKGSQSIDDFVGDPGGNEDDPVNVLSFEPNAWDFGSLLTTATTPLSKSITVKNQSAIKLYISGVSTGTSSHFTMSSETCSATGSGGLAVGDTCSFVVDFLPTAQGLHNFAVTFTYGDTAAATTKTAAVNFIGFGAAPASLLISDGPTFDFGPIVATAITEKSFTVTNIGNVPATSITGAGLAAPFAFKGGAFPGVGGTCGVALGASANCSIVVVFNPLVTGLQTDTIELTFDSGAGVDTSTRDIQGTGATPAVVSISDAPGYDFGTYAVGASADKVLTLTNSGGVSATALTGTGLNAPFSYKGGSFPGTGGTCAATLASGASCTLIVNFAPTATGVTVDTVEVGYNDGLNAQTEMRALQGTAVPPAVLSISHGPTYDYGTLIVSASADMTFTVNNSGGFGASFVTGAGLAAPFSFKGGSFPGTGGTCGVAIPAAGSCTIVVTYAPTAAGSFTDTIEINYVNGAVSQTATRPLQALAVTAANLTLSDGPTYDFGIAPTGATREKSFTVTNAGGTAASAVSGGGLAAPYTFKGGTYPGTGGSCGATLNPGANCTIVLTYAPTTIATHNDAIEISYNNGLIAALSTRAITGTGVAPASLAISDGPTFDYGSQPIGKSIDKVFTLTNSGGFLASSIAGTGLAAPYAFKGGGFPGTGGTCTATLASSASCTFVVTYQVAAAVVSNDTIDINYTDGVNAQTSARDIVGTGVTPANITITDGPTYDFGPVATGGSAEKTLTLNNAGMFAASAMNGSGLAAPFTFKGGAYPGTGGTCGTSLAGGASCTVVVRFAPTSTGTLSDTMDIAYNNGVSVQTSSRGLQGVGTLPATLVISDGPTYIYATIPYGAASTKSFTVTNAGGVPATTMAGSGLAAPFTFLGGSYPGTGGDCGVSLAASATCTIVVEYNPSAAGTHNDAIDLTYFDAVANQTSSRAVRGTAVNPALLAISGGPTYNFGTVAVGGMADATLTVSNSGQYASSAMSGSGLAAPYTFKGGIYPGTGGTCAATLNAAASCTIVITYSPSATGLQSDTVEVNYNNGVSAQIAARAVQGTGAAPALIAISDGPSYDFGSVATGGFADKTLTLTNSGGVPATAISGGGLAAPFTFKGGTFPGTGGTCTATLNASATCVVVVTFAPSATGVALDTIDIAYNDGASAQTSTRDLQGTGVAPANLALSDGPLYDYGSIPVTGTAEKILTVTNGGNLAATSMTGTGLAAPFRFKGGSYPGTGGTCGASLAIAGSCTIVVAFNPTVTGTFSDTVILNYFNGAGNVSSSRDLQGVGAAAGTLTISDGATYNFGSWPNGDTREKTFTVTNSGGVPSTGITGGGLAAPFTFKGGAYPGTGATCGVSLAPAGTCTIIVQYSPSVLGTQSDTIELNYNNGLGAVVSTRDIQGTSVPPAAITISDGATYDFNTVAVGGTAQKTFTLTNSGGFSATSVSGGGLAAPFAFKGGTYPGTGGTCGATLNVGNSCSVVVTYSPSSTGLQADAIDISFHNGVSAQVSSRAIQGTGAAPALLGISDGPTYNYGSVPAGGSADKALTITNSGGVAATGLAGSGLAAPFSFKGGSYPGTGGTCAATLNASATCTIVVTFAPSVVGTPVDTVDIAYLDGVNTQTASRDLAGTAVAPASITISDGPTYDYGTRANGSSTDMTFTLTNGGDYAASSMVGAGLAAPFTFKGGAYPGTGGTCGASLANAGTCTIVVTFAPTVSGARTDTIEISYNNGALTTMATRAVQGTGATPATLAVSDGPTWNFGTRATGSSTDKTLTITNSGGVPATSVAGSGLAAPFAFKGGSYPGTGGTCTATINALSNCTVVVTYAPTSTGAHSDTADFNYDNGVGAQLVSRAFAGVGAAPANLAISDGPTYNFGTHASGGTAEKSFTVSNSGGVPATTVAGSGLAAPYSFKGGGYPGTGGTCTATLNASASCTIIVVFAPTSAGTHIDTIDLAYNDGVSAQTANRDLTGDAVTPADLQISDSPTYDFGTIPTTSTADKVLTVTNAGSVSATAMSGSGLAAPFTFKGGTYPGTGGTCAGSLAGAATCTVVVTFAPTVNGARNDTIDIAYFDGAANRTASRAIQGTGAPPASLTISDGATYNYGNIANGGLADKTFTITNSGGVQSSAMSGGGLAAPFTFKGGSYPGTAGTCGGTLAPTATCTIVVTFNPTSLGTKTDSIEISYNNGLSVQMATRALQGVSVNPANLNLSDGPTYNYGTWATGATRDRTFTVTNSGDVTATALAGAGLAAPFTFKGGTYPGTGGTCAVTLNALASCTVVVTYAPTATGTQTDSIEINYVDGVGPQTALRPIQGTGAAPAQLAISDGLTYDYGTLAAGGQADKVFTITNSGGVPAASMSGSGLAAPYSFKGGGYPGTGGTCTASLNASATCTIVVTYNPTVAGTHTDTVTVSYNDGVNAQSVDRDLTGIAVAPASITISDGATYNFGTLANGASADKTFTLNNAGAFQATGISGSGLAAPFTFKGGSYPGTGGTCGATLNAGASCVIVVTFAPTTSGLKSDTIDINYNDGAAAQISQRPMQGTGAPPAVLAISDGPTYNFGTKATGSSQDKTFTVTNSGGVNAATVTGSGLAAPFTFKGGSYPGTGGTCAAIIAGGSNCTLVVNYSPTATGSQSDTVQIDYNDGVTAQTATVNVQGTGAAPATLAVSDGPTWSFGSIANGGTSEKTLTLTNSGGVPATAVSGGGLAAPFTFKGGTFPGTGGNCTATLNASATCSMVVVFVPTVAGLQADQINISYNDGVTSQSADRDVEGTGVPPALLTISDGPTYDYGPIVATGSVDKTFTVTNGGSLQATTMSGSGLAAPFTFKGGSYPGTGGTCGATLNTSATCTIVVTFNPTVTGSFSDTIDLAYYDGAGSRTSSRGIQGTGATAASITISDGATFNFGNLAQGALLDKTFTLTNGGGVPATTMTGSGLAAPFFFKGGAYPGTGGTCGATLNGAATCTIVVTYNPTTIATHNDTIDITYNTGLAGATSSRNITGTGVAPANLTISNGATYDFLTVATGGSAEKIFTVTNAGSYAATAMSGTGLAAPFTFKGGSYPGTGGNCGTTLNPAATCTIVVVYAPTATGTQSDSIELNYFDGANNQMSARALQGTGAAPATLTINEGPLYDFGTVANGSANDKSFVVTNSGGVPAIAISGGGLAAPFSFKGGTYPGTGGTCAATLASSATCTVVVSYNPSTNGTHTDAIDVAYDDGVTTQGVSRNIQGTAVAPANIGISNGPTYNFGLVANGSTNEATLTLTNSGALAATAMSGSGLAAPYSFKGGGYPGTGGDCSTTLAPAGACTIVVVFAPSTSATHNDTIDIAYNNGATNLTSQRNLTGISAAPAVLAISETGTYDYGTKATGSSTDKTFTISNSGGVNATSVVGAGLAAPFTFKGGSYPGTGGDCGATIASAGSCTIVVTYAPTGTGAHSDSIDFTYHNGVSAQAVNRPVQGLGASPATLTISDATSYDYGSIANGGSADHTFTLNNSGGVSATAVSGGGLAAPFTFKGGGFPGTGGNCGATINAGASCSVVVTFAPTSAGLQTDTMDISFHNGVSTQSSARDVQGTGVTPAILTFDLGPTLDFGPVVATGSADRTLTLTNSGSLQATAMAGTGLAAPFTFKGGAYPGTGGTCGLTLNASNSCTVVITFNPTVTGPFADTAQVTYHDGAQAQTANRDVQGTGATPASITISDGPTFSFGNVAQGSSQDKTFTLTNGGGVTATAISGGGLAAPYSFKGGGFPGTGGTCGATLTASNSCTIVVNYNPSTVATHTDTIDVSFHNGLTSTTASRDLTGTAVAPASITISGGATYDYGTRATGSSTDQTFTLTNAGSFAASSMAGTGLAAPFTFKGGGYPGTGGNCGATLNPAATCTIVVTYAPTGTGSQSDAIDINYYDGANNQTSSRPIQGTGAAPATLTISDGATFNYGTVAAGSSNDKSFTITNTGGVPATAVGGGGLAAPFGFKGGSYPGTGGTCSTTLAASGTCTIVVTYNPSVTGTQSDSIDVTYTDGVTGQSVLRAVTGTAVAPADIQISNGPTYNFGLVANGSTNEATLTLTNAGALGASAMAGSGLAAPYAFKGGTYPGTGGTCSTTLASSGTCTIVVTFAPSASATHNDTIDISFNNGATTLTSQRDVTGISAAPATLAISDGATYNFGTKATGSSTDKSFTVTNTGGIDATSVSGTGLAAPFSFKGGSYPGTGGTCAATIASAANCTIVVVYAPTATGAHSDAIDMNYTDGVTAQTSSRAVQGVGAAPATLAISDGATYNFGSVANGGFADKTFTITNGGGVPATSVSGGGLAAPFAFKGGGFPGTGGTCTASLNASDTCTVVVTFAPTVSGAHSDTIDITFNNGVSAGQTSTRDVTGTGVTPAILTLSDSPIYDFGPVVATGSADRTLNLTNSGSLQATGMSGTGLAAPFTFKGGGYPGSGGTCGATLNASAACTIVVTFNPTVTGPASDTVIIPYNDGAQAQNATRDVQGTGASAASITISHGATYNFGNVAQGSTQDHTFTLNNGGGVPATSMAGTGLAAPFTFKGGSYPGTGGNCGTTLNAAASCTIVVNYNPSTVATHTDTVDITYNDGLAAQTSQRNVQGTAVAPASITISDGPTYDYLTVATGASRDKSFTLTNAGAFAASAMTGSGLAAPFTFKGGTYPGAGGNCGATLNAAATCTIVVTYAPTATGVQSDTVLIDYNNGASGVQSSVNVQGTGANPALLTISDAATYSYGNVANGSSNDHSFTITNSGGVPATAMSGGGLAAPYSFKGGGYPGTGGTCSTSLPASGTCTIVVTYAPTATGTQGDTIEVAYNDGVSAQQADRPVTGQSSPPATLTISETGTYNYGTKANGSANDKVFTVTNTGAFTATAMSGSGLAAPYTFKGGSYPGTGGDCSTTLAGSNATCTIVVTFAPTASGTHNDTIDMNYNNGLAAQTAQRPVTGVGAPPALLAISETGTYNFGTKATGSSTDKSFTITNSGGIDAITASFAALGAPFSFKGGAFPGTGGNCTATIAASATCTVVVTYAPTATGTQSEDLEITYNDGVTASATVTRPLQGTGAAPATITISDASPYNFGSIANGGSADKSFTITNTGGVGATSMSGGGLAAPFTFKGGSYPGAGGNCAATLAATATCTIVVTFAPTVAGAQTDDLDITYNNGVAGGQVTSRTLNGTGVPPATLTISNSPVYDFGPVVATGSADYSFTINNTGSLAATSVTGTGLAAPFTFKGGTYPGIGGNCGTTINASATCTIVVTFAPGTTGSFSDTLDLNYFDGAANQTSSRDMQGTGATAASISISHGATHNFGNVAQGSSQDHTFTLTNGGGVSASSMAGSGLAAPYTFKGGSYPGTGGNCGTTLAPAGACQIVVNYNPTTVATHTDTIDITYNDGLTGQTAQRPLTGTALAPASITISDGPTYDFTTVATGASRDKSFTLTNGGGFTASGMSGAGLAAPFTFKGGAYPGTGGNCAGSLNASATCTIVVTYAPTATGTQTDTVDISYSNGASAQTAQVNVQGTGAAPALLTTTDSSGYNFGSRTVTTTTERTFTITNTGGVTATGMSGGGLAAPFAFKGGGYPGTTGTCGATLGASATCTIVVTYAPTTAATHNDTFEISYSDGVNAQMLSNNLTGTGTTAATLSISDGPTYDFGALVNGAGADKTFTITNGGGSTATSLGGSGLGAPFTFKGGTYPGSGGTCGASLAVSNSCTIVVRFSPSADGSYNDTIDIGYNDGASVQTSSRDVTGVGAPAAVLSISDGATFNFGTLAQGGTADKSFTITNTGGVMATTMAGTGLAAPYTFKGGSYPGTGGTCAATLASTLTCTIVVTYNPTTVATHTDTIEINYTDGATGQTATRALTGTAVAPASLTISGGPTYDFGTKATGTTHEASFTVTNGGGFSASSLAGAGLAAPYTFKGGTYPGIGGNCGTTLGAAGSCTIIVVYAPTATGTQADTIEINYNNGATAQQATRDLTGVGAAPATLTLSDAGFDYGLKANGSSTDKTFVVTNGGGVTATSLSGGGLAAPFTFKGGGYPGSGGNCSTTLAAGATCQIVVSFAPLATNSYSDTIEISYDDGTGATLTSNRAIQGSSAAPAVLTVSGGPGTFNFGTIINGSTADQSFTITNTGAVSATSLTGTGLAVPYTFKGGSFPGAGGNCGISLAAAASCTVVVSFSPSASATYNDTMDITYNDGVTTQISSRDVEGAGGPAANIQISNGPTYNFNTVANGSTNEASLTLTNTGGASATSMAGSGLAAPYSFKGGSYPGTGGNCGATLTGSASCTIVIVYSPTTNATHNDAIDIAYHDGASGQTSSRNVAGTAVAPASLSLDLGPTYDYGTQPLTKATDRTFTITNGGAFSASGMTGTGLSAPFAFKGGAYPGSGGNCGAALAASASCTIVVTYTPTSTGAHSGQIDINYNNGASAQTASRAVQGLGATVALLAVSDGPTYPFGIKAIGLSGEKTFTVTNSGGVTATSVAGGGLAAPFFYKGGTYPGTGGDCGATLAAATSCQIVVVFTPSTSGAQSDTIDIGYNDGLTPQTATRDVTGTGANPALLVISDGPLYNYGNVATAASADKSFTINNTGGVAATSIGGSGLASPFSFKGGTFPGSGGSCGSTLASSDSCTVVITFAPLTTGVKTDTFILGYNDAVNAQTTDRDLQGTATPPAAPTALSRQAPAVSPNNITSTTIRVQGVAEADVVKLFTDSGCTAQVASGTVGVGATQIDIVYSGIPSDGAYTFYANRTNTAGTISACSTATATYTLDTTPPVLTGMTNQNPARSPHWNRTPTMRVTGTFASDTVRIYSDSCTTEVTNASATGASVDINIPTIASQGTYTYYARAFDSVGNASGCLAVPVTYDYDVTDVTVAFTNWSQIVTEGASNVTVTVPITMSASKPYATTLYYRTHGTSVNNQHTTGLAASGTIVIPANTTNYNWTFQAKANADPEKDKYVDIVLWDSNYEYVHVGGKIYHRVLIKDNDSSITAAKSLPRGNGYTTACFIDGNSKLWCVGGNTNGTVGDGTTTDRSTYQLIDGTTNYKQVSVGRYHACALTNAGDVKCWGSDAYGQLGDTVINSPAYMSTPQPVTTLGAGNKYVSTGAYFSCAINALDKLYCWGRNNSRQVGDNTTTSRPTPTAVDASNSYSKVSLGDDHVCAIRTSGALYCWGGGAAGAVGNGSTANTAQGTLYNTDPTYLFTDIAAGDNHTCGVTTTSKLHCWGENSNGQLGKGNTTDSGTPAEIDSATNYSVVATGRVHTCALTTAGAMRCAGNNAYGQHFDRSAEQVTTMYAVAAGLTFNSIAAFEDSTWAQLTSNEVYYAGGDTLFGYSGDEVSTFVKAPTVINDAQTFSSLDNGFGDRAQCHITATNKIRCSGFPSTEGIFGIGSEPLLTGSIYVDPKNDYLQVASGRYHMCAIRADNKLFCAGHATYSGTGVLTNTLTAVDATSNYAYISVGYQHSCGILTNGDLKCWGTGANGRLGTGGTGNQSLPILVHSGTAYSKVAASITHTCGLTTGGAIYCWGEGTSGRLGIGSGTQQNSPQLVGTGYIEVAVGEQHTCAIQSSGQLQCWGEAGSGQLGQNSTTDRTTPFNIDVGNTYIKVAASTAETCAVTTAGALKCTGSWLYGIAGQTDVNFDVLTNMDSGTVYTDINAGRYSMCGKDNSNQVRCWGNNWYNTFGNFDNNWFPDAGPVPGFNQ